MFPPPRRGRNKEGNPVKIGSCAATVSRKRSQETDHKLYPPEVDSRSRSNMPVETLERLTTPTPKKLEILIDPDPGGTYEGNFDINGTIIFARSSDRNLVPPESQEPEKTTPLDFEKDLRGINRVKRFLKDGGVEMPEGVILNYNIALALWGFQEARLAGKVEEFKKQETQQVEKALRERYNSTQSTLVYIIDENLRLRNDIYPKEPFAKGMQRGVLYLRQQGSPDSEREEKELEGFLKIEEIMVNPETALHTKMMVISPPSKLKGSIYTNNFVDFYELVRDEQTGKRVVRMTRFATSATYAEGATDTYFLSHPTTIDATDTRSIHEIFGTMFSRGKGTAEEKDMQIVLSKSVERIRFYINALCNPVATAENIAVAFNAIPNGADLLRKGLKAAKEAVVKGVARVFNSLPVFSNIREEVEWLGRLPVEQIAAACGMSAGFSVRGLLRGIGNFISNISRIFSGGYSSVTISTENGDYHIGSCVVCKRGNVLVGGCDICTSCEKTMG